MPASQGSSASGVNSDSKSDDNDLTYFLLAQVKVILQAIGSLHAYLERKAGDFGALLRHDLRHAGYRYTVLSHQNSHGISHQTARSDDRDF